MNGWLGDLGRVVVILAGSSACALLANAFSPHPLTLREPESRVRAPRITADELRASWSRRQALLLLDVRSEESFREGHSPRAIHAPASAFLDHYRNLGLANVLRAADGIVVACEGEDCSAGDYVAKLLRDLGHPDVRVLVGGWPEGRRAGLESESW